MDQSDIVIAIRSVVSLFKALSVSYYIGGSVASSAHGIARATLDIDIVANLDLTSVDKIVSSLEKDYYVSGEAIQKAIIEKSSFNLIHLATMVKIDVFIQKDDLYSIEVSRRVVAEKLEENESLDYYFVSPEDIIIHKLLWFQLGDRVSERQWHDVLGVIKVQGELLDLDYLRKWAKELGVLDLLEEVLNEGI